MARLPLALIYHFYTIYFVSDENHRYFIKMHVDVYREFYLYF